MYDFFSIPVEHIDNREQFVVTFSYIFADFRQMGGGGASFNSTPFLSPFCFCGTGPEEHKSANHLSYIHLGSSVCHIPVCRPVIFLSSCHNCGTLCYLADFFPNCNFRGVFSKYHFYPWKYQRSCDNRRPYIF
jgi:hypothetical protein